MIGKAKGSIHVKYDPVTEQWEVLEMTPIETLIDDAEKYGVEIALENQAILIGEKEIDPNDDD